MSEDEPTPVSKSSWKREVPSPWIDCASCGWRHYPDTSQRRGPPLPTECARCGDSLAPPPRDEHS